MLRDLFHSPFDGLSMRFDAGLAGGVTLNQTPHFQISSAANFLHALTVGDRPAPTPATNYAVNAPAAQTALVASSPSMADEVSFISGINDAGQVVATSFATWNYNRGVATYGSTSYTGKYGADHATDTDVVTVHYFFRPTSNFTADEKAVYQQCMALWSAVTNVHFEEAANNGSADLLFKRGADGSAYEFDSDSDSGGAGTIGGTTLFSRTHSTVSIDTSVDGFGPIDGDFTTFGGYVWGTIIHEMGHALGLGHAGAYNGNVHPTTQQYSAYDSLIWSIMSYIEPHQAAKYTNEYPVTALWGKSPDGFTNTPTTWMPLDIAAIQQLYGTPLTSPLSGGQVFGFNCNIGGDLHGFFDFTVNVNPVLTIFDIGTGNTLDLSGFTTSSTVDLNPGTFSSCDGKVNNIAIDFNTVVETAIGGSGTDNFTGNTYDNTLVGNRGNDTLNGAAGTDDLNGGAGKDTLIGGTGADALTGGRGDDTIKYADVADSSGGLFDTAFGFDFRANHDHFDLPVGVAVSGVDATVASGALSDTSFDGDLESAVGEGELAAHHVVLFTPDSGDEAGQTFLVIDANGTAGYQGGEDFVINVHAARHLTEIAAGDFI